MIEMNASDMANELCIINVCVENVKRLGFFLFLLHNNMKSLIKIETSVFSVDVKCNKTLKSQISLQLLHFLFKSMIKLE